VGVGSRKPREEWEQRREDAAFPVYESAIDIEAQGFVFRGIECHFKVVIAVGCDLFRAKKIPGQKEEHMYSYIF